MEVLFTFLAERYERRSVIITSNLVFSEWDRIFKDPMTTAAAIDRLVHHSVILEMTGTSIRIEQAQSDRTAQGATTQSNLDMTTTATTTPAPDAAPTAAAPATTTPATTTTRWEFELDASQARLSQQYAVGSATPSRAAATRGVARPLVIRSINSARWAWV